MRNTIVDMSLKMTLRMALASDTLMRSIVNLSSPRSSVFETMRGMYLDAADLLWKGADDSDDAVADDIIGFVLGSKRWIRLYIISL